VHAPLAIQELATPDAFHNVRHHVEMEESVLSPILARATLLATPDLSVICQLVTRLVTMVGDVLPLKYVNVDERGTMALLVRALFVIPLVKMVVFVLLQICAIALEQGILEPNVMKRRVVLAKRLLLALLL